MAMGGESRAPRSAERPDAAPPKAVRGGEALNRHHRLLAEAALSGRRLSEASLRDLREWGAAAADRGTPLHTVLNDHFTAARRIWATLRCPQRDGRPDGLHDVAQAFLRAGGDSAVALSEGYETAHRAAIRREEASRREFVDDLLEGRTPLGRLAERAERFGLRLAGPHTVSVGRAQGRFQAGDATTRYVEDALTTRFGGEQVLITTKDGLLVCVASGSGTQVPEFFAGQAARAVAGPCRIAVSRPGTGPSGIVRSYQEARRALDVAHRLGFTASVVRASDVLVFQVLERDRAAITDLVGTVLGGLEHARGGPGTLLETLAAYFATGCSNTGTARRLGLGVRTVGYRIARIRQLTGYDPIDPDQRYVLQTAVLGARLLGWPANPLQSAD